MSRMAELDHELRTQKRAVLHAILQQFAQTDNLSLFEQEIPTSETYARDLVRMLQWEFLGGKRDAANAAR